MDWKYFQIRNTILIREKRLNPPLDWKNLAQDWKINPPLDWKKSRAGLKNKSTARLKKSVARLFPFFSPFFPPFFWIKTKIFFFNPPLDFFQSSGRFNFSFISPQVRTMKKGRNQWQSGGGEYPWQQTGQRRGKGVLKRTRRCPLIYGGEEKRESEFQNEKKKKDGKQKKVGVLDCNRKGKWNG